MDYLNAMSIQIWNNPKNTEEVEKESLVQKKETTSLKNENLRRKICYNQ